jgi:hypothetical protein
MWKAPNVLGSHKKYRQYSFVQIWRSSFTLNYNFIAKVDGLESLQMKHQHSEHMLHHLA